jgi:phosphoribosyl 1,2-cyclic phosphodiesterase
MSAPNFPVTFENVMANITYHETCKLEYVLNTMTITPIPLNHPNQGVGYRFTEDGKSFVFLTDNELRHKHQGGMDYDAYREFSAGADLLIHDAEYDDDDYKKKKSWGHSTYRQALQLAREAGVKRFGLYHHNQDRSDRQVDIFVKDCKRIIKENHGTLKCFAVRQDMEIEL